MNLVLFFIYVRIFFPNNLSTDKRNFYRINISIYG